MKATLTFIVPLLLAPLAPLLAADATKRTPTTYKGADLVHIKMPVGGIVAGQLYFNGDGSLGRWDIMNVRSFGDRRTGTISGPKKALKPSSRNPLPLRIWRSGCQGRPPLVPVQRRGALFQANRDFRRSRPYQPTTVKRKETTMRQTPSSIVPRQRSPLVSG